MDTNANTLMRDPSWNEGRRTSTLVINPTDAQKLGLKDSERVRVVTEAGEVEIEAQVSAATQPGFVVIPHGFGLEYAGAVHGVNVNRLTSATHRDRLAGTPLHRHVPCRVERIWGIRKAKFGFRRAERKRISEDGNRQHGPPGRAQASDPAT